MKNAKLPTTREISCKEITSIQVAQYTKHQKLLFKKKRIFYKMLWLD